MFASDLVEGPAEDESVGEEWHFTARWVLENLRWDDWIDHASRMPYWGDVLFG